MNYSTQIDDRRPSSGEGSWAAVCLLLLPGCLLLANAYLVSEQARWASVGAAAVQFLVLAGLVVGVGIRKLSAGVWLLLFYFTAFFVLRFLSPVPEDARWHGLLSASLAIPTVLFAISEVRSGNRDVRRAKFLMRHLVERTQWPEKAEEIRRLPEIRALRECLRSDPGPVLPLLAHTDHRIRAAALFALECQPVWRKGQAEIVIQSAHLATDSELRSAALMALADVKKPRQYACLVPFLRDAVAEVRRAAALALFFRAADRWADIRQGVRDGLSCPDAARDGPLPGSSNLPGSAIHDLVMWSAEGGALGKRSSATVIRHVRKVIEEGGSSEAIDRFVRMTLDPKAPAAIRVETAHRLRESDLLPPETAVRLIGPEHPTLLRLSAAGAILALRIDTSAVDVLRDAAKHPNREISLQAAVLIQKFLGEDMGLPVGGSPPPVGSREAAEIARRVIHWADRGNPQSNVETPSDGIWNPSFQDA